MASRAPDELITPTRADLRPFTIPQLKQILREHGLRAGGSKFDLMARILEAGILRLGGGW